MRLRSPHSMDFEESKFGKEQPSPCLVGPFGTRPSRKATSASERDKAEALGDPRGSTALRFIPPSP